jgi:hypothetical protein
MAEDYLSGLRGREDFGGCSEAVAGVLTGSDGAL